MKYIDKKNPEPPEFTVWKSSWQDMMPGWGEFDGKPIKQTVKKALLEEQGGLCCFCESRVEEDQGHIAHLRAQSKEPDLALVYENLLYSCPETQTCGHAQGVETPDITPLDAECEWRFVYTRTGAIAPRNRNDEKAIQTISILKLNEERAVSYGKRAKAYQSVEEAREEMPSAEFDLWINTELQRQPFTPYWTTIKYAAGLYT